MLNYLSNLPQIDYQKIFSSTYDFFYNLSYLEWLKNFFSFLNYYQAISTLVTLILSIGIFYSILRIIQIRQKEAMIYYPNISEIENMEISKEGMKTIKKWDKILNHLESENINDWKVAIIETDILLGEMLDKVGYQGDSIGEKLKRVEKGDLITLDKAWEAHKVRNEIAHQGSEFAINQREARRVVAMYKEVINELERRN
ncbi:MAG: hypothetical protein NUV47_02075 [Patescibacteria group bacterium]|nr:hypothetical protein [Patescibacteria group bacterium]